MKKTLILSLLLSFVIWSTTFAGNANNTNDGVNWADEFNVTSSNRSPYIDDFVDITIQTKKNYTGKLYFKLKYWYGFSYSNLKDVKFDDEKTDNDKYFSEANDILVNGYYEMKPSDNGKLVINNIFKIKSTGVFKLCVRDELNNEKYISYFVSAKRENRNDIDMINMGNANTSKNVEINTGKNAKIGTGKNVDSDKIMEEIKKILSENNYSPSQEDSNQNKQTTNQSNTNNYNYTNSYNTTNTSYTKNQTYDYDTAIVNAYATKSWASGGLLRAMQNRVYNQNVKWIDTSNCWTYDIHGWMSYASWREWCDAKNKGLLVTNTNTTNKLNSDIYNAMVNYIKSSNWIDTHEYRWYSSIKKDQYDYLNDMVNAINRNTDTYTSTLNLSNDRSKITDSAIRALNKLSWWYHSTLDLSIWK